MPLPSECLYVFQSSWSRSAGGGLTPPLESGSKAGPAAFLSVNGGLDVQEGPAVPRRVPRKDQQYLAEVQSWASEFHLMATCRY